MINKILNFLSDFSSEIIFIGLVLFILILFLKEFKITSKRSWIIILSLVGLGGLAFFRAWNRKKLLEQLREREEALRKLEKEYAKLKQIGEISKAAYEKQKQELERIKKDTALETMKADEALAEKRKQIEEEYESISTKDLIDKVENFLKLK